MGDRISFQVSECSLVDRCYIWYEFNRELELMRAEPDDQFRNAHKQFYANKPGDHALTAADEAQFRNVRCLAGCPGPFVPQRIP
ncbi:MAG: hypothetical protein WCE75_15105 [Terracidiphilus sp.]